MTREFKTYDLYCGPTPQRLRTFEVAWEQILREAYSHNYWRNHPLPPPEFIGRMPVRQDIQVEPLQDKVDRLGFAGWSNVGMTIRWVRPTLWGRMVWRFKKFFGLFPKVDAEPRRI